VDQAELKALGLNATEIIDFSVCTNPFISVLEPSQIIDTALISCHPDSEATEFRENLAKKLEVSTDNILAGNGAMEPIRLIAIAYFSPGDSALILEPTFGEYRVASHIAGARVFEQWGREEENFMPNINETIDFIQKNRPKGVFICNPNNPTGQYINRQKIEDLLDVCQETLLVLDEAYLSFVENSWSSLDLIQRNNLVIVRSMTKDYALAGLRLGFAVAHQEIINTLRLVQPPWSVNSIAQKAGIISLKNADSFNSSKRELNKAKDFLLSEFHRLGFTTIPSETNFFLVKTGKAKDFRSVLLKQGIMVRDCTSFGLPDYVRIAVRPIPECQKLITAIEKSKEQERDG